MRNPEAFGCFFSLLLLRNTDLILEAPVVQGNTFFFFPLHSFLWSVASSESATDSEHANEVVCTVHQVGIGLREENMQGLIS